MNPTCSKPLIEIVNRGTDTLKQIEIHYGINGDSVYNYTWNGTLPFMKKKEISLPPVNFNTPAAQNNSFFAAVLNPNGLQDQYYYNDTAYSNFEPVPEHDVPLVVYFQSNNNPQENEWKVYNHQGNVVYSQSSFNPQTLYMDTLYLSKGCYELVLTDSDHDGISFWANNETNGFMRLREKGGPYVAMIEGDFGKEIRYPFRYNVDLGIKDKVEEKLINVFPNPADGKFNIVLDKVDRLHVKVEVFDNAGKKIYHNTFKNTSTEPLTTIDLSGKENGIYLLKISTEDNVYTKKILLKNSVTSLPNKKK